MTLGPVMLDIEGTSLSSDDIRRLLHPLVGGVILFTRNYESSQQLIDLTHEIHALRNPPLLIAVDHEGGRVQRFKKDFTKLPAMRTLGALWDQNPDQAKYLSKLVGYILAAELSACGVDLSFTPILDIDYGQSCVIGDRAFHRDSSVIAHLAQQLMEGLKAGGMQAVGKHFPGHGYIQADSHLEQSIDYRSYAQIEAEDLVPFQKMINSGMAGVMAAHVIYPQVDPNSAGFSHKWLKYILRDTLQFNGCIFSDDLSMKGAGQSNSIVQRALNALNAGCDMILVCNDSESSDELLSGLKWSSTTESTAHVMHMYGERCFRSLEDLREDTTYISARDKIAALVSV